VTDRALLKTGQITHRNTLPNPVKTTVHSHPEVVMHTVPLASLGKSGVMIGGLPIPGADPWHVSRHDPAVTIMTDFRERASVTVRDAARIDDALEHMKHTGVRCAFAIDEQRRVVVGMITAYDIMSERPMRHMQATESPRSEVLVSDIMTPIGEWRVADMELVERATVGDIARLCDASGLTHLPVMELNSAGERRLRGLISAAKIRRLLG